MDGLEAGITFGPSNMLLDWSTIAVGHARRFRSVRNRCVRSSRLCVVLSTSDLLAKQRENRRAWSPVPAAFRNF